MKKEYRIIEQGNKLDKEKLIEIRRKYGVHSDVGITDRGVAHVLDKVVNELGGDIINFEDIDENDIVCSPRAYVLYEPPSCIYYSSNVKIFGHSEDSIIITKKILEERIGGLFIFKED